MTSRLALIALAALTALPLSAQTRPTPVFDAAARLEHQPAATALLVLSTQHRNETNTPVPADAVPASGFASSGFAQFMSSPAGRVLRVVAGAGMIAGGLSMDSNGGNVLAAAGVLPLAAGAFDICWISPLFGGPFRGRDIRAAK